MRKERRIERLRGKIAYARVVQRYWQTKALEWEAELAGLTRPGRVSTRKARVEALAERLRA